MVSGEDVASVVVAVVVRGVGVRELCVLVQADSMSTLVQIRKGCFMTIASSRRDGGLATNVHVTDREHRLPVGDSICRRCSVAGISDRPRDAPRRPGCRDDHALMRRFGGRSA